MPTWQDAAKVIVQARDEYVDFETAAKSAFDKLGRLRTTVSEMVEQCAALEQTIARLGVDRDNAEHFVVGRQGQIDQELTQHRAAKLGEIDADLVQARAKVETELVRLSQARDAAQEQAKKAEIDRDIRLAKVGKDLQGAQGQIVGIQAQVREAQEAFEAAKRQMAFDLDQLKKNHAVVEVELKDRVAQRQKEVDRVERKLADLRAMAKELAKIG